MAQKRRKNLLARAKGYRGVRSKKERYAHEALLHAGRSSFAGRRDKKNDYRSLWIVRVNAAVRANGHKSYSTFISKIKKNGIQLDRKVLSTLASDHPETFTRLIKKIG